MELTEANVSCAEVPSFEQNVSVGWVQCEFDMDWSSRGLLINWLQGWFTLFPFCP
ncbi:hypothetical protein F2Q69_00020407 [Brassica cretica]|uniref:Uncharacterized protein n=1 Tax=Brassica cretica TaxID=69181 RepID=A0A8S9QKE7_BRACR|nr:hypothetical protein F2Q69_00020407 [Brassica cretica]